MFKHYVFSSFCGPVRFDSSNSQLHSFTYLLLIFDECRDWDCVFAHWLDILVRKEGEDEIEIGKEENCEDEDEP